MHTIKQILDRKSRNIATISPDKTVFEAISFMAEKNYGSVVVMEHENYLGILTERDYARKVILQKKSSKELVVKEIMSTDLPALKEDDTLETCMEYMSKLNVRYLPVMESEKLVGLISIKDVVDEMIIQHKETINQLTNYINQGY